MPPVFAHGRLRLYLLKLLDEAPRHGYEVIRMLEERFQGLYAPSAGTVYPRLSKLEAEGRVTHTTEGGRKVYAITDAGRAELRDRSGELAELELEIRESVAALASDIREDVSGSARDLRREVREAAARARTDPGGRGGPEAYDGRGGSWGDWEAWRQAKEELRRAKEEWKEQARRAKEESRRAKQDAQRARKQARDAQAFAREEVLRVVRRVQEQTQGHVRSGDWTGMVREALSEVSREVGRCTGQQDRTAGPDGGAPRDGAAWDEAARDEAPKDGAERDSATRDSATRDEAARDADGRQRITVERVDPSKDREDEPAGAPASSAREAGRAVPPEPEWAHGATTDEPARDFDRLLDRFRDDLRDAARDHGVSPEQLRTARRHLSTAAAHIGALLRRPDEEGAPRNPER